MTAASNGLEEQIRQIYRYPHFHGPAKPLQVPRPPVAVFWDWWMPMIHQLARTALAKALLSAQAERETRYSSSRWRYCCGRSRSPSLQDVAVIGPRRRTFRGAP